MSTRTKMDRLALPIALALVTGTTYAQTTITGTAGGADSWNVSANWSAGVPSGAIDAIVGSGVWARVDNAATPIYSGTLTLDANALLTMACSGGGCGVGTANAVENASGIFMSAGSEIQLNLNVDVDFPPVTLLGDAKLSTLFGASDWQTDDFGAIDGAYTLTLEHFNGHTVNLNGANGFAELILDTVDRWNLNANAAGALGTGNVTVNPRADGRSASLVINADNAIADSATLFLNGLPGQGGFSGNGSDYLVMNANDTVAALWVYGVQQPNGVYTNTESWLAGQGTLTVSNATIGTNYCGPANSNSTGLPAILAASGSDIIADNDLSFVVGQLPQNQFGYFVMGESQGFIAVGQGFLCIALPFVRFNQDILDSGTAGQMVFSPDLANLPAGTVFTPGDTWNFQCWYRDLNPGNTSNLSDGVSIVFQ